MQEIQPKRVSQINKIIVKQSVLFYAEAWKNRNDIMHNQDNYRSFVIDWYNKVIALIERDNRPKMIKYLRAQRLNIDRCESTYIRQ